MTSFDVNRDPSKADKIGPSIFPSKRSWPGSSHAMCVQSPNRTRCQVARSARSFPISVTRCDMPDPRLDQGRPTPAGMEASSSCRVLDGCSLVVEATGTCDARLRHRGSARQNDTLSPQQAFRVLIDHPHLGHIEGARSVVKLDGLFERVTSAFQLDNAIMPDGIRRTIERVTSVPIEPSTSYAHASIVVCGFRDRWHMLYRGELPSAPVSSHLALNASEA